MLPSDERFTPPDPVAPLPSGVAARLRRLYFWVRAGLLGKAAPTAGAYDDLSARLEDVQARLLQTEVQLAVRTAERDAAQAAVDSLAAVVKRDQERVRAESAAHTAARERNLSSAGDLRGSRATD